VNTAITQIPDQQWTAIHYPQSFVDTDTGELVSDAEVAQTPYTAFTSRPQRQHVQGVVRVDEVGDTADPEHPRSMGARAVALQSANMACN
jgi:hypothetical protein